MRSQLINVVPAVMSLVLIIYNVNIYKVQKTPVQQNWLSTCLGLQLLLPLSLLIKGDAGNVLSSYVVYMIMIYGFLYNTKFCISCKKSYIKKFILMLSICIPVMYIFFNVELFRSLFPSVEIGYLSVPIVIRNVILIGMTLILVVLISIIGFFDKKNVHRNINLLRIFLVLGISLTCVAIVFGNCDILIISKLVLVMVDAFLIMIVWAKKGRFHKND